MATDLVDRREPKVGLVGGFSPNPPACAGAAPASVGLFSASGSVLTAGEAGIVLNRFLPSVAARPRVDDVKGRVDRGVAVVVAAFEAGVVGGRVVLVGLRVLPRAAVLLSIAVDDCIVDRRSGVAETVFDGGGWVVLPARDIRFAEPVMPGFRFSSPEAPDFDFSSTELREARGLCVAAVGVLVVGGLRGVALTAGRVGGLVRLPPSDVRLEDVGVGFVDDMGVEVTGRFEVVKGRLGGTAVLERGSTFLDCGLDMPGSLSCVGADAAAGASVAVDSGADSVVASAMVIGFR